MTSNPGRGGHAWRRAKQVIRATQSHCGICGGAVDVTLPYRDRNGNVDPMSSTVDHIKPLARGGNPLDYRNLQLAHLGCNSSKGAGQRTARAVSRRL